MTRRRSDKRNRNSGSGSGSRRARKSSKSRPKSRKSPRSPATRRQELPPRIQRMAALKQRGRRARGSPFARQPAGDPGRRQVLPQNNKELAPASLPKFRDPSVTVKLPESFNQVVFSLFGNVGFPAAILIEMLWLLRTHKNSCFIAGDILNKGSGSTRNFDTFSIEWVCVKNPFARLPTAGKKRIQTKSETRILKVPKNFKELFINCINASHVRFIMIPVTLINDTCQGSISPKGPVHANMILYDKKTKTMERFEPWGFLDNFDNNSFDKEFSHWIIHSEENRDLPVDNYLGPLEICPRSGFQALQEEQAIDDFIQDKIPNVINNMCSIWSNWYANLRMTNPSIRPARVVHDSLILLQEDPEGMSRFILRYASFVRAKAFSIFKEIGVDMDVDKNFRNEFINNKKLDQIIEKINTELKKQLSMSR